jgi:hypothetical protein
MGHEIKTQVKGLLWVGKLVQGLAALREEVIAEWLSRFKWPAQQSGKGLVAATDMLVKIKENDDEIALALKIGFEDIFL